MTQLWYVIMKSTETGWCHWQVDSNLELKNYKTYLTSDSAANNAHTTHTHRHILYIHIQWNMFLLQNIVLKALTYSGQTPPACEAASALAAPVSLFQTSSSSPCALIRDPSSHSGTTLRHFQLLPFPFRREFLNWQLEHDPNRRTDAIRQKKERVKGRRGPKRTREEEAECFYCHVSLGDRRRMREEVWTAQSTHRPRPRPCVRVCACVCVRPRCKLCYATCCTGWHSRTIVWVTVGDVGNVPLTISHAEICTYTNPY